MVQSRLLCFQPTGTTNAETLHTGQTRVSRAYKHLFRSASSPHFNMVVASLGAKAPIHVEFKMVVASHVVFIQCPASCPRLRQEYGRRQRTHPPQFATRRASPLSKVVAHRRQTTVARIRIEAEIRPAFASAHTHPHLHTLTIPNTNSDSNCPLPPSHGFFANAA